MNHMFNHNMLFLLDFLCLLFSFFILGVLFGFITSSSSCSFSINSSRLFEKNSKLCKYLMNIYLFCPCFGLLI